MAKEQRMHMPGVFGGIMRYDAEYQSRFMINPTTVIIFVVAIILFVLALNFFMEPPPINNQINQQGGIPAPTQPASPPADGMGGHSGIFYPLINNFHLKV